MEAKRAKRDASDARARERDNGPRRSTDRRNNGPNGRSNGANGAASSSAAAANGAASAFGALSLEEHTNGLVAAPALVPLAVSLDALEDEEEAPAVQQGPTMMSKEARAMFLHSDDKQGALQMWKVSWGAPVVVLLLSASIGSTSSISLCQEVSALNSTCSYNHLQF